MGNRIDDVWGSGTIVYSVEKETIFIVKICKECGDKVVVLWTARVADNKDESLYFCLECLRE